MKTHAIDDVTLEKIHRVLQKTNMLCQRLDQDGRVGEIQRASLTADIRTQRNLRNLSRNAKLLALAIDFRP